MEVVIAGGHGKIAMLLHPLLVARGDTVRALIRNPDHADEVRAAGAEPVYCDLEAESDISTAVGPADAVVFAAGAGPGSGPERKRTMDRDGAVKLIAAAEANGIGRYLMISAMGAGSPPAEGGGVFGEYLRAKAEADRALAASGLDFTTVRPGSLTDDPPKGSVAIGESVEPGEIPRGDVAAVVAACLAAENTIGKTLEVVSGDSPLEAALAAI